MENITMPYGLPTPEDEHSAFLIPTRFQLEHKTDRKVSEQRTPKVSRLRFEAFGSHDDLVSSIVESMKRSGGCIIEDMMSLDVLSSIEDEIRPYMNKVKTANSNREDFVPSNTRMVTGLLSKSKSYALNIAGNNIFQSVSDYFLTSTLSNSWHGTQCRTSVSKPQLSTTITFSVQPGTPAQGLHRDDDIYHTWHPETSQHHIGRDTMVCFFVAGSKCTSSNGATRMIPGSHLWDYGTPPPSADDTHMFSHAEMKPGDVFMMLGGVYHGAGSNTTINEERLVHAAFATRGYLRQEENQYLANDLEKMKLLPRSVQEFAGFGVSKPFMGWVDLEDPVVSVLGGEKDEHDKDFW